MKHIMKINLYMNADCPKKTARAAKAGNKSNRDAPIQGQDVHRGRVEGPLHEVCEAQPHQEQVQHNTKREDVKCSSCNRMGHVSNICLDTYYMKSAQRSCPSFTQKQTF